MFPGTFQSNPTLFVKHFTHHRRPKRFNVPIFKHAKQIQWKKHRKNKKHTYYWNIVTQRTDCCHFPASALPPAKIKQFCSQRSRMRKNTFCFLTDWAADDFQQHVKELQAKHPENNQKHWKTLKSAWNYSYYTPFLFNAFYAQRVQHSIFLTLGFHLFSERL